jgi:predicted DNA-binding transcriptional regulator AlpA
MNNVIETLLTENEVAELLNISVATIRRRRLFRQPPEFVKIGASVRYRPEAIQRLIESSESSTAHFQAASVKAHSERAIRSGAQRNAR